MPARQKYSKLLLVLFAPLLAFSTTNTYLRVNQVGYRPEMQKIGLVMSRTISLEGDSFFLFDPTLSANIFTGQVGVSRSSYGDFAHVNPLDFSEWTSTGQYALVTGTVTSPVFSIEENVYGSIQSALLSFFQIQRCGTNAAAHHGPCHLNAKRISGGPLDGQLRDVSGGWHDAGDYLKFMLDEAGATLMMQQAWRENANACADGNSNGVADVLEEVLVGSQWIRDMWDPENQVFYFQETASNPDHYYWRLPEGDDQHEDPAISNRYIYACEDGKGANVAGLGAAALAESAMIWNASNRPFYNPVLAADFLSAATGLYAFGTSRPVAQAHTFGGGQTNWKDYMGLAATLLYEATGETRYLDDARQYAADLSANSDYYTSIYGLTGMLHYRLAQVDAPHYSTATNYLYNDVWWYEQQGLSHVFRECMDDMQWGSMEVMSGKAVEAFWYERLTGDSTYRTVVAEGMLHYLLGNNPWGVSFIAGLGSQWAHDQHHQIADLLDIDLFGSLNEGPITRTIYNSENITLKDPDEYADFQSDWAVYHDDLNDYTSNEPVIGANGMGVALAAWFVGTPIIEPDFKTNFTHILIDYGTTAFLSTGMWNNVSSAGTSLQNTTNTNGKPSGISVQFPTAWEDAFDYGVDSSGLYPETAQTDYIYAGPSAGITRTIQFNGLSDSKRYTLRLFASRESVPDRSVQYMVGGITNNLNVGNNTNSAAVFTNIAASGNSLVIHVTENNDADYIYINAIELIEEPSDSDQDGLPDSWEQAHFNSLDHSASEDFDHDGFLNIEEYIAGTQPENSNSIFTFSQKTAGDLLWNIATGRLYTVYWTSNLFSSFSPIESNITDGNYIDLIHTNFDQGFYRIEVELP